MARFSKAKPRGLWGPVCINVPLLAAAYQYEQELATKQTRAALAAKERPDNLARAATAEDAASDLLHFQRQMRRIAMLALAFDDIDDYAIKIGEDESAEIMITGLPHYIFNQTTADLESTTVTLLALRAAAATGRMPRETWRPRMEGITGVPRPEQTEAILARTANAIKNLQQRSGDWTASNLHQPVTAFNRMSKMLPGLPVDPRSFTPLPSPQTPLATLQGYTTLVNIGHVVGFERALGRFRANFGAGLQAARRQLTALPDRTTAIDVGGRVAPVSPYEAYFYAVTACDAPATRRRELGDAWARMAFELVATQQTNGTWTTAGRIPFMPTSMAARAEMLPQRDPNDRSKIMERDKAHLRYNWPHAWHRSGYLGDRQIIATCHALLFLLSGSHPPFLSAALPDQPLPGIVPDRTLQELAQATGVEWYHMTVDLGRNDPLLEAGAPALFLSGSPAELQNDALRIRLVNYIQSGGILIALGDAADPATATFMQELAPIVAAGSGADSGLRDVSNEQGVLGDLAGRLGRSLQGMLRPNQSLAALILPLAAEPQPAIGAFSQLEAARIISTALRRNLDDTLLTPAYSHQLGDLGSPATLHATAMQLLRTPLPAMLPPAPKPTTPPPAAPQAAPAKPTAAATAAPVPAPATAKPPAPKGPVLPLELMTPATPDTTPAAPQAPAADELW